MNKLKLQDIAEKYYYAMETDKDAEYLLQFLAITQKYIEKVEVDNELRLLSA